MVVCHLLIVYHVEVITIYIHQLNVDYVLMLMWVVRYVDLHYNVHNVRQDTTFILIIYVIVVVMMMVV